MEVCPDPAAAPGAAVGSTLQGFLRALLEQTQAVGAESPPPQLLADAVCQASLEAPQGERGPCSVFPHRDRLVLDAS